MNAHQGAAAITRQMAGQAYLLSSDDIFRGSAWAMMAMIALVWLARITRRAERAGGGGLSDFPKEKGPVADRPLRCVVMVESA